MEVSASDAIAGSALCLSVYTIWRQHGLDKLNRRLSALLIEKEEEETRSAKRADISANFVKVGKNDYRLRVYNRGKGIAKNVTLRVISGESLLSSSDLQTKFPFPSLQPHQSVDVLASVSLGSERRVTLHITWDDPAGGGEAEITDDAV